AIVKITWPRTSSTESFSLAAQSVASSQNPPSYGTQMQSNMPSSSNNAQPSWQTSSYGSNSQSNSISSKSYYNPSTQWMDFTSIRNNPINDQHSTNLNGNNQQSNWQSASTSSNNEVYQKSPSYTYDNKAATFSSFDDVKSSSIPSSRWPWSSSSSSNLYSKKISSNSNNWKTHYENNKDSENIPVGQYNTSYNWWKSSSSLRPNGDEKMVGTTRRAAGDGSMEDKEPDQENNNSDGEEQSTVSVTWSKPGSKSSVTWSRPLRPGSTASPGSRPFTSGPAKPLTCSNIVLTKLSSAVFTNKTMQKCFVKNKKLNPNGLTLSEMMLGLGRDSRELRGNANGQIN
ncbi:hypothetical protein B566_EDAN006185, partial [Ephemera danica]